jgi:hypothetical protein
MSPFLHYLTTTNTILNSYRHVMANAISFCLKRNDHELIDLLMNSGAILSLESINVKNVNIWLSRETPESILDNLARPTDYQDTTDTQNRKTNRMENDDRMDEDLKTDLVEESEAIQRVNTWLRGVLPDSTVDLLTQYKHETARMKQVIDIQEKKIHELSFKCRRLQEVERQLLILKSILKGLLCCTCQRNAIPPRPCQKPIGEVCSECQEVVKTSNNEIQVGKHKAHLASYGVINDFYNGLDAFSGKPLAAGEADILYQHT